MTDSSLVDANEFSARRWIGSYRAAVNSLERYLLDVNAERRQFAAQEVFGNLFQPIVDALRTYYTNSSAAQDVVFRDEIVTFAGAFCSHLTNIYALTEQDWQRFGSAIPVAFSGLSQDAQIHAATRLAVACFDLGVAARGAGAKVDVTAMAQNSPILFASSQEAKKLLRLLDVLDGKDLQDEADKIFSRPAIALAQLRDRESRPARNHPSRPGFIPTIHGESAIAPESSKRHLRLLPSLS
jgi:hypothetical protein